MPETKTDISRFPRFFRVCVCACACVCVCVCSRKRSIALQGRQPCCLIASPGLPACLREGPRPFVKQRSDSHRFAAVKAAKAGRAFCYTISTATISRTGSNFAYFSWPFAGVKI